MMEAKSGGFRGGVVGLFTYLASLAWLSSSLALVMCCELWFTMPPTSVMLARLSLICRIIFSRVLLGTGSVMDRTC